GQGSRPARGVHLTGRSLVCLRLVRLRPLPPALDCLTLPPSPSGDSVGRATDVVSALRHRTGTAVLAHFPQPIPLGTGPPPRSALRRPAAPTTPASRAPAPSARWNCSPGGRPRGGGWPSSPAA